MIQNFPIITSSSPSLLDFTFYVCLPLEKAMDFLTTMRLRKEDFEFCEGNPINLSLNAMSATFFYQCSQSLARHLNHDEFNSEFLLITFRMEAAHLTAALQDGSMTTWNRLYVDYFHSVHDVTFTDLERSTFRCWTFAQKTRALQR